MWDCHAKNVAQTECTDLSVSTDTVWYLLIPISIFSRFIQCAAHQRLILSAPQPNCFVTAIAPIRALMAWNSATVSSMICCTGFTAWINPADWPASAGAAFMSPPK